MKITKQSRILLLAMTLGDGHVDKYGQLNLLHSDKQLEYLEWKKKLLNKNGIVTSNIKYRVNNKRYKAYYCSTKVYMFNKLLRRVMYKPTKQLGNLKLLNRLKALHIAIWYMDDGSINNPKKTDGSIRASNLYLHTNVSREENLIIIDYFLNRWNIKFTLAKKGNNYIIYTSTKGARQFIELVKPYVEQVKCLHYKLIVKDVASSEAK